MIKKCIIIIIILMLIISVFCFFPFQNSRENYPSTQTLNLLYSDIDGNMGSTSDIGINYLTVQNNTSLKGTLNVSGNISGPTISDLQKQINDLTTKVDTNNTNINSKVDGINISLSSRISILEDKPYLYFFRNVKDGSYSECSFIVYPNGGFWLMGWANPGDNSFTTFNFPFTVNSITSKDIRADIENNKEGCTGCYDDNKGFKYDSNSGQTLKRTIRFTYTGTCVLSSITNKNYQ